MIQMGFCQTPLPTSHHCNTASVKIIHNNNNKQVKIGATATWSWRDPFQIFTTILLTLLFPLSFLLLARLSTAHYLLPSTTTISHPSTTIISRLFLYASKSIILYALVSLVTAAAFLHRLSTAAAPVLTLVGLSSPLRQQHPRDSGRPTPTLYVAWVVLCTFQVCVGLGIEGSISAKIDGLRFGSESNLVIRALLLLGLHEAMLFWAKSVVKPVVEDTVLMGSSSSFMSSYVRDHEEVRWAAERVGMGLSLGALWWWRLREEVDSMVVVPEVMLGAGGGIQDVGWWLYYLTVSMGSMRGLKAVIWMGMGMVSVVQLQLQRLVCKNKGEKKTPSLTPSSSSSLPTNHRHLPPTLEDMHMV